MIRTLSHSPVGSQIITQDLAKSRSSESISEAWKRQKEAALGFLQQNRCQRITWVKCAGDGAKELVQMLLTKTPTIQSFI